MSEGRGGLIDRRSMSTEQHEGIVLRRISFLFWKELEGHAVLGASEEATSRGEQYALGGVLTQGTTWPSACIFGPEMVKRWARGNECADGRRTSLRLFTTAITSESARVQTRPSMDHSLAEDSYTFQAAMVLLASELVGPVSRRLDSSSRLTTAARCPMQFCRLKN